ALRAGRGDLRPGRRRRVPRGGAAQRRALAVRPRADEQRRRRRSVARPRREGQPPRPEPAVTSTAERRRASPLHPILGRPAPGPPPRRARAERRRAADEQAWAALALRLASRRATVRIRTATEERLATLRRSQPDLNAGVVRVDVRGHGPSSRSYYAVKLA